MSTTVVLLAGRVPVYHPPSTGSGGPFDWLSGLIVFLLLLAAGLWYWLFMRRSAKKRGRKRRSKR